MVLLPPEEVLWREFPGELDDIALDLPSEKSEQGNRVELIVDSTEDKERGWITVSQYFFN